MVISTSPLTEFATIYYRFRICSSDGQANKETGSQALSIAMGLLLRTHCQATVHWFV